MRIEADNDEVRIKVESKKPKKLHLKIFDKKCSVRVNKEYIFHKRKMHKKEGYY